MLLRLRAYKGWTYTGFTMTYQALGKSRDLHLNLNLKKLWYCI